MSTKQENATVASEPLSHTRDPTSTATVGVQHDATSEEDTVPPLRFHLSIYTFLIIIGAYLILLVNSLQMTVVSSLTPFITSAFNSHSLIPVMSLVSSIVTGVIQLPLSRAIDRYGRPQGLVAMLVLDVLGLVVMATSTNVKAYAAAQVLYSVGAGGVIYVIRVFAMDKVPAEARSLVYSLSLYTYFVTPFTGPALAQAYYQAGIWRWALGSLALIIAGFSGTLTGLFSWRERQHRLATAQPVSLAESKKRCSVFKTSWKHAQDLDVLGVLLACFGLGLVLLPMSLATKGLSEWASPTTISMFVVGFLCLISLVIYESRFAPQSFINFDLHDRTAWGACLGIGGQSLSLYLWWTYYTSFLQVVHFQSIRNAGYLLNARLIASAVTSMLTGLLLKHTHRFKAIIATGLAVTTMGTGLMIHFSSPDSSFGGVIASHIIISISSGVLAASFIAAVLNNGTDDTLSMRVALLFLFSWIGSAIGSTIAAPLWRSWFPSLLEKYLPGELKPQVEDIYGSLVVQLSYRRGTPGRNAIVEAMAETWKYMSIVSTATLVVGWIGVLLLKEGKPRSIVDSARPQREILGT